MLVRRLRTPLGLAWRGRDLFVSEQGRLERLTLRDGRLVERRVIVKGLPFGGHQQDNVVLGPNGRLSWGSGSTCDACRERDPRNAAVLSLRPDGSDQRIRARGLRNPYGVAFQPGTGRLYASMNGQDELGSTSDPEPAEMVVVVRRGAFYGWPRCWPNARTLRLSGHCGGRRQAGGVPRAACLGRRARLLHGPLVPARLSRQPVLRGVGRVPELALRPPRRPDSASARRHREQRDHVCVRLRASARAARRPGRRSPRRRLGPRRRLTDPGRLSGVRTGRR